MIRRPALTAALLAWSLLAGAQEISYQPKFPGDPARSNSEAAALGYARTLVAAQKVFKQKRGRYAQSLQELVGSGSFTRRMTSTQRGDYRVQFRARENGYSLELQPAQLDVTRRSFYVDQTGILRAEEDKPAAASSPKLK